MGVRLVTTKRNSRRTLQFEEENDGEDDGEEDFGEKRTTAKKTSERRRRRIATQRRKTLIDDFDDFEGIFIDFEGISIDDEGISATTKERHRHLKREQLTLIRIKSSFTRGIIAGTRFSNDDNFTSHHRLRKDWNGFCQRR